MKVYLNGKEFINNAKSASGFWDKLRGIIGEKRPVVLNNTNSIHTLFLNKNISAVFADKNGFVLKVFENIKPYRIIFPVKNACHILEFDASFENNVKISVGDTIEFFE